jgi:hypothetical protein
MIRLFVPDDLSLDVAVAPSPEQARYLTSVMRLGLGDAVALFNGRDGAWLAKLSLITKRACQLTIERQVAVQTEGPDLDLIVALVKRGPLETIIEKAYPDAFEATDLEGHLAAGGIGRLYVTGAQTDACIRSTLHGGFVRGYDVVLIGDAHTTEDLTRWGAPPPGQVIAHTNLYWRGQTAPGREARVVSTEKLVLP